MNGSNTKLNLDLICVEDWNYLPQDIGSKCNVRNE